MSKIPALRIRKAYATDIGGKIPDLSKGFTLEAWVRPAPRERAARLFPQPLYAGRPVRFKAGLYRRVATDHLPELGSVCLPEHIEIVCFSEPDFQGVALALRHDTPQLPDTYTSIGSLVVLDRSHRRQNHVILFEKPGYEGRAQVLTLPETWQAAQNDTDIAQIGSAWVPPGVALEIELEAQPKAALRGDLMKLPEKIIRIRTRRDKLLQDKKLIYKTNEAPDEEQDLALGETAKDKTPAFQSVRVPAGTVLVLFEKANFEGQYQVVTGDRDDLTDMPWGSQAPGSFAFVDAPDGPDGAINLDDKRVYAPQSGEVSLDKSWWLPDGYRFSHTNDDGSLLLEGARGVFTKPGGGVATLERYEGVLCQDNGAGLTIMRVPSEVRGAPDELRFCGRLLRPDRWSHLAQTWDGDTLHCYLDGCEVKQVKLDKASLGDGTGGWALGRCYRGDMARVRVWNKARSAEQIRTERFPSVTPSEPPALDLFANGLDAFQHLPAAAVVSVELPQAPADTSLVKQMRQQVEAEQAQVMQGARKNAAAQLAQAQKQAQRKTALAHEKARRDIHIKGIKDIAWVRGNSEFNHDFRSVIKYFPTNLRETDMFLDFSGEKAKTYASLDGGYWSIRNLEANFDVVRDLPSPPRALAGDFSGNHPQAKHEGKIWTALYWIEEDGAICRAWIPPENGKKGERQPLLGEMKVPLGRPEVWDIAIDMNRQQLYWTNGRELYWCDTNPDGQPSFQILLPHAASPFPLAVAVAPDGSLLWLDAEDEMVRMLPFDAQKGTFAEARDLYPAPRPARGLAVCRLPGGQGDGKEVAFVYWVATERRTLELPVLDTPGRYIDVHHHPQQAHGQHIAAVSIQAMDGARWEDARWVMPLEGPSISKWDRQMRDDPAQEVSFGPFAAERGFILTAQLRLDGKRIEQEEARVNKESSWNKHYAHALMTISGFARPLHICDTTIYNEGYVFEYPKELPKDEWLTVRVEYDHGKQLLRVFANDSLLKEVEEREIGSGVSGQLTINLPANKVRWAATMTQAFGDLAEVTITELADPTKVLAKRTPVAVEGEVTVGAQVAPNRLAQANSPAGSPTALLIFDDPADVVEFEPIRLDLKAGWTATADLIWEATDKSVCVYELATFEDEDRLVCAVQSDGLPVLHLRWNGRVLTNARSTVSDSRLQAGERRRVTWMMDGHGNMTTYIDGEKVTEEYLAWPGGVRAFETHCLGAPGISQIEHEVPGALLHTESKRVEFAGFRGKIVRFAAWNSALLSATVGWRQLPGPDPTWARSLVTVESKHRYLQAGRLDRKEPPVTLFPIDIDGGLNIETKLETAHAELMLAHAKAAAASAYAVHLKEAALKDGHARLDAATRHLVATQAKAAADIAAAQTQANQQKADANRRKVEADAKAARDRAQGKQQAHQIKTDSEKHAADMTATAAKKKRERIAAANQRLSEKQQELDRQR